MYMTRKNEDNDSNNDTDEMIKVVNNNIYFYSDITKKSVLEIGRAHV